MEHLPHFISKNLNYLCDAYICNNLNDHFFILDAAQSYNLNIPTLIIFEFDIPRFEEARGLTPLLDVPDVVANVFLDYSVTKCFFMYVNKQMRNLN